MSVACLLPFESLFAGAHPRWRPPAQHDQAAGCAAPVVLYEKASVVLPLELLFPAPCHSRMPVTVSVQVLPAQVHGVCVCAHCPAAACAVRKQSPTHQMPAF